MEIEVQLDKSSKPNYNEILRNACALLNSDGGGKLVVNLLGAWQTVDVKESMRSIEQHFEKVVNKLIIRDNLDEQRQDSNKITIDVKGSRMLCTLNTNLYITTNEQVLQIPGYDNDSVGKVLTGNRIVELENMEGQIPEKFVFGSDSGLRESKTVQLKQHKAKKSGKRDLFTRMTAGKLTHYISGFANGSGGCVYYGIDDHGVVQGEKLEDDPGGQVLVEAVTSAVNKMIWPAYYSNDCKPWNIKFVPVLDSSGNELPTTFVIVISISPCPGGVFAKVPESYHFVNGKIENMNFDTWKRRVLIKEEKIRAVPLLLSRIRWSKKSETRYMLLTEHLEKLRQLGKWNRIENIVQESKNHYHDQLSVNDELVLNFQLAAVAYRQGNFDDAKKYLTEFQRKVTSAEDPQVFQVEGCYSAAAIERSSGNYGASWKIIQDGLQKVGQAPAGLVPAALYCLAASILTILAVPGEESSHDHELEDKCKQDYVDQAEEYCYKALQHLKCVHEGYEIAKEELSQRISITLSFLYLGSSLSAGPCQEANSTPVPENKLNLVEEKVTDSEKSLRSLRGTEMLAYNSCRLRLVRSDLDFRRSQLNSGEMKVFQLEESLISAKAALELAEKKSFEDIKGFCKSRIESLQSILSDPKSIVNKEYEQQHELLEDRLLLRDVYSDEPKASGEEVKGE